MAVLSASTIPFQKTGLTFLPIWTATLRKALKLKASSVASCIERFFLQYLEYVVIIIV
jgi:hypothetical protein